MAMKRPGIVLVALLLGLMLSSAAASAGRPPDEYILPGDEVYPEGISYQRSTGYFYVSSTTDGTIFRGHVLDPVAEVFLPGGEDGRTTAVGLDVDRAGRLFVAGGSSGFVFVYDTQRGSLLAALEAGGGFFNDVATTRSGDAYFTNSLIPVLYRVSQDASGAYVVEEWLDLEGTAIEYVEGFNLNGIVVTPDDRYLIVVQSITGKLFRIEIATGDVVEIDLGSTTLTAGDGLALWGRTLYVVRNSFGEIAVVRLSSQVTSGVQVATITDPSFRFPTTADIVLRRLLVVNAQFDARETGDPELPFTVSSVELRR